MPWGEEAVGPKGHCSVFPSLPSGLCWSLTFKFAGWGSFLGGGGVLRHCQSSFFWFQGLFLTWEQQGSGTHWAVGCQCWQVFLFSTNTF